MKSASSRLRGTKQSPYRAFLGALLLSGIVPSLSAQKPVDYVNPMIGASTSAEAAGVLHGLGKTFPGPATPFGLIQLSPDTITGGDNGPGYSYHHKTIEGFSFTHMSGIGWYGDLGNFLVMPTTGELKTACGRIDNPDEGYRSRFDHATETAQAGYYSVLLADYNIRAELAAAPHAGILRFTYPHSEHGRIQIDLARRVGGTSTEQYVKVVDSRTIEGWMKCPPEGGGWGDGAGKADYTVYFYCQFSVPLTEYGVWIADIPDDWQRKREDVTSDRYRDLVSKAKVVRGCREMEGKHLGFFVEFPTEANQQVLVKSGISFVSIDGARKNLEQDIPDWDFDRIVRDAQDQWNRTLSRIQIQGGTEDQNTIFYTALYHTMIDPRCVSDVDGSYRGADGKIHTSDRFQYRTIFSGWDVFRSQFPLQTIINPEMVNDEVNSLLQLAELSGHEYYPRWEILNAYSGCMIGNPAVSVLLDAYVKGIRDYDVEKAYRFCRNSVEKFGNQPLGYQPEDISRTLEYAYTDWCVGRFAELLGNQDDARTYYQRSKAYKSIYDPNVQWFHARNADRSWTAWQGKEVHGQGCVESNPYQQGWFVPHDIGGLIELLGKDCFMQELTAFFEKAPSKFTWNDYYNHPNEPVHHVAFMFPYAGQPWLTQKYSRIVCEQAYGTGVDGLCGNEDVGQMSAWYVLAASGLHPVCPGDGIYILTSPLFEQITFQLSGRYAKAESFAIIAKDNSDKNRYIQSVKLNGKMLNRLWITHNELITGGTLELQMGPEPNTTLGADVNSLPTGKRTSADTRRVSFYTTRLDDPAAVYLTKDDFPVHGDGVGDDSAALQQAIDMAASRFGGGVLFIPAGTYRLTKTVYVWPGVRLIGYGNRRPTLMLAENTPGFQDGEGKYMLFFSGGRSGEDGSPRDGNPGTFYSAMSNIDIEIAHGNPAAVGIRFHVAQHCYLSHMNFRLGSATAGLEDIGNEVEDLCFQGGRYGIITKRSAPGWPILVMDCTFQGQSEAAISGNEAGLAIVRPQFKNVPTVVSMAPDKADELWISDARFENVTSPALVIGNEDNARTQINLQNIVCKDVPILVRFPRSGRTVAGSAPAYLIERFSHGLQIEGYGDSRQIKTTLKAREVTALPAPVQSDIPELPDCKTWVNVCTLGAVGDNRTDNTAILKKAIAEHQTLYFPMGWYCVSDTLQLRPDTVLIGLHPSATVICLPDGTPAFQGEGAPAPLIEAPQSGTNIITGIGVYTGAVNPRAVGVKWMAGAESMMNDVRLHGGHGTRIPGQDGGFGRLGNREAWNSQNASLWVTNEGGGTFKDIWTPSPYASSGMEISDTSTSGRVYAMSVEHHVRNEMVIRNASNWRFYALQFEEEREEGPEALPLEIDRSSDLLFANAFFYRVISSFVPFPYAVKVSESRNIWFRNFHCYSNSKVSFDSAVFDQTANVQIRDNEFAVLDILGGPAQVRPESDSAVLAEDAVVEKLTDGFLNISGAAVDSKGDVYFVDTRKGCIYRWSHGESRSELVRQIPEQPVQLAFDKADNLLVIAYEGDGTVLTFRPDDNDSEIISLKPVPAAPRPQMTAILPVNRWMGDAGFIHDSTMPKPFHYISTDGTAFIPAGEEFTTGAKQWGIKAADLIRAFGLAPAAIGRPFYVTNELELKTWSFDVGSDGALSNPKLFVQEGGEGITTDQQGNVYIAAGQILVFDPTGKQIDTINVPQRPTCLVFGGGDRRTLFITARSALYSVRTRFAGVIPGR